MNRLQDQWAKLLQGWEFFTRIPLPTALLNQIDHSQRLSAAAHLFPILGTLIGIIGAVLWHGLFAFLPPLVTAGLVITAITLLTGALHEDGLSDCADGLVGGHTREQRLEIMKDSRIGAYGALALIFSVGLRWAALSQLDQASGAVALILVHTLSRMALTYPICFLNYARTHGLGSTVSEGMNMRAMFAAMAYAIFLSIVFAGWVGLLAFFIVIVVAMLGSKYLEARIGGYTGDGLGALQQLTEISVYMFFTFYWSQT